MSSLRLGSNIASLNAQRRLAEGSSSLSRTFERLSSGQRINRASDDAAGLAIADSLRVSTRVLNQGVRNLNDGISLLSVADSALENLTSIVVRLEELAQQAASGTYGTQQRKAVDAEAQALRKEFFRISKTARFNDLDLLGGSLSSVNLQAGVGESAILSANVGGAIGTGSFAGSVSYKQDLSESSDVALGDLNGDGFADLVTAGYDGSFGTTTVRLGNGDGTFGEATSYYTDSLPAYPWSVVLGDLNNDGSLDLVTTSAGTNELSVRLNTGNGTFGAATSYNMETDESYSVTLGDLNGDGVLDLVTGGYDYGDGGWLR